MNKDRMQKVAALVLAAALGLRGGCSGGGSREPEPAAASEIETRMKDPAYLAKLDGQRQEMYAAMDGMAKAQAALDAARASAADAEEIARLEAALKAAEDALAANQKRSQAIVRAQLRQARAEQQKFNDETRKGN